MIRKHHQPNDHPFRQASLSATSIFLFASALPARASARTATRATATGGHGSVVVVVEGRIDRGKKVVRREGIVLRRMLIPRAKCKAAILL